MSYTAHIAQKRPQLLGGVFGDSLLKSHLSRASLTGAHAHARAASLLSSDDAVKHLTRCAPSRKAAPCSWQTFPLRHVRGTNGHHCSFTACSNYHILCHSSWLKSCPSAAVH